MRCINVTAHNHFFPLFAQFFNPLKKDLIKGHFERNPLIPIATIRKINIEQHKLSIVQEKHSSFCIKLLNTQPLLDILRFVLGIDGHTAVPFLFSRGPVALVSVGTDQLRAQLIRMGLGLL